MLELSLKDYTTEGDNLWKVLVEGVNVSLANVLKSLLEENGIEVVVKASKLFDPVIFGQGGSVDLLVPEEKLEQARSLMEEARKDGEENPTP
ncbi:putative signal transducing protein [Pseudothermotoga sp.]